MKKIFLFTIALLLNGLVSQSQVTWEKLFSAKNTDVFRSVQEVPSGGYVVAGYTSDSTASDSDAYVVRMTTSGDTLWTYRQNIGLSKKDLFYKVINTADGGFALCGYTSSITGISDDILIVKLTSSGQMTWTKTIGGSGRDRAQDIVELSNGSFAIAGYTTSPPALYYDAFLYKIDANGDSLWFKRYGTAVYDDANSVRSLSNGGFLLAGQSTNGANGFDLFLIRTNDSGDTLWTKKFGTAGTDNADYIAVGTDGYFLAGGTNGAGVGGDDGYVVKTDTSGSVLWSKTYGGSQPDDFHRIEITMDGGLIMSGTTSSTGPLQPNIWLLRANSTGDSLWSKSFGGDNHDHGYSADETSDGGFIVVGHTGSFGYNGEDGYVGKTDSNGDILNLMKYTTVSALITPTSVGCGTSNVQVKVLLRNFGNATVPNVPTTADITGALTTTLSGTYNGIFFPQDADTLLFPTTINTTTGGTFTFVLSTSNNNDVYPARNSMTVTLTIDGNSGVPTVTGGTNCGQGTVTLTGSSASTIYWYDVASGGSPLNSGPTFVTPSISVTTPYYAQTGLVCASARVPVTATINTIPTAPTVTDGSRCGTGTVDLSASSANTIEWYDVSSGGSSLSSGANFTTPSISTTTPYYVQAVDANTCISSRATATATINTIPADPTTTDSIFCGPGSTSTLLASGGGIYWYDDASGTNQVGTGGVWVTPTLSATTTFYAQSFNGTCGSAFIPATATMVGLPTVSVGPDTAVEIGTAYLMDAGAGFSFYQWNTGDQTQTVNILYPDTFCVTVTDANGCTNSDCAIIDFFVGVSSPDANNAFSIYPNPATENFNVAFKSSMKNSTLSIVDVSGKIVLSTGFEKADAGTTITINTSTLASGIYFVKISSDEKQYFQKLILE
ncbi:MAG TPA: T9SS type A sorting domain-containing protein [Bacteroidia bacterium]|nr:T9SS type A sorting domain-containing protein [Bacteroidia bacterium]